MLLFYRYALYTSTSRGYTDGIFGFGNGPVWYTFSCDGTEANLDQCSHTDALLTCKHGKDAGAICLSNSKLSYHS